MMAMTIVVMRANVGTVLEPFLRLVTLYVTSRTRGLGGLGEISSSNRQMKGGEKFCEML